MINRYPGICASCGTAVKAREGVLAPGRHRKWEVRCGAPRCGTVVDTFGIGGKEYIRNARGRCIDAPCCGCCTI